MMRLTFKAKLFASAVALSAAITSQARAELPEDEGVLDEVSTALVVKRYKVTITNLTDKQQLSPAILASHKAKVKLNEEGMKASPGLVRLAEEGMPDLLATEITATGTAKDVVTTTDHILPGESKSYEITVDHDHPYFSGASMLVTTNDGFGAVHDKMLYKYKYFRTYGRAYDAGSEMNSEKCMYIPGPPCMKPGVRDPEDKVIMKHMNIKGVGDLSKDFGWRGSQVIRFTFEKIQ